MGRVGKEAAAAYVAQMEKEPASAEKPTHSERSRVLNSFLFEGLFIAARTASSDSGTGLRAKCVMRRATFFFSNSGARALVHNILPTTLPTSATTAAGRLGE